MSLPRQSAISSLWELLASKNICNAVDAGGVFHIGPTKASPAAHKAVTALLEMLPVRNVDMVFALCEAVREILTAFEAAQTEPGYPHAENDSPGA